MRDYELVVIISPEVSDEGVPQTLEKLEQMVTSKGGSVTSVEQWGRRKLAYPIRRFMEGTYVLSLVKLEPSTIKELETDLLLSDEVLRHLLIKAGE